MTFSITTRLIIQKHNIKNGLLCFFILFAFSCKKSATTAVKPTDTTATLPPAVQFVKPSYDPVGLDTTKLFNSTPVVHDLARTDLLEISGVAASRINPGVLYIHNDSGNPNQVYLTNGNGDNIGTLTLTSVGNR